MTGDIVKLKSGQKGVLYYNDTYAYAPVNTKLVPGTEALFMGGAISLAKDPIAEHMPRTKDTILSMATALPRLSIIGGLTSGTDPEIFVFDKQGDVIPAWKFLPQKDNAIKTHRGGGVLNDYDYPVVTAYWDGAQAEITIAKGEGCHAQLVDDVRYGLKAIYDAAQKYSPGSVLRTSDVVKIDEQTLMEAEDVHVALGCAPSLNAYKNIRPIKIEDPRRHMLRYSGSHLHYRVAHYMAEGKPRFGSTGNNMPVPDWFPGGTIKMLDRVLGLLLTALGRDLEDPQRRIAYGRPGEYRQTAIAGLEYRTPGAFLMCRPEVMNFALDMGRRAFGLGMMYNPDEFFLPGAKDIIMSCDADEAVKRIEKFSTFFEALFTSNNYHPKGTMNILRKGLKAHGLVGTVMDNWKLAEGQTWNTHNNGDRSDFRTLSAAAA